MAKFSKTVPGALLTQAALAELKKSIDSLLRPGLNRELERIEKEHDTERESARSRIQEEFPEIAGQDIAEKVSEETEYLEEEQEEARRRLSNGIEISTAYITKANGSTSEWRDVVPDELDYLKGYETAWIVFGSDKEEDSFHAWDMEGEIVVRLNASPFQVTFEIFGSEDEVKSLIQPFSKHFEATVTEETLRAIAPSRKVFIGHGGDRQWEATRKVIIEHGYEVEAFEQKDRLGQATLEQVIAMVRQSKVAIIVMSAADRLENGSVHARQNVIHELGLAQGILGAENTIILKEESVESPSNLAGITELRYKTGEIHTQDDEIIAAIKNRIDARESPNFVMAPYPQAPASTYW